MSTKYLLAALAFSAGIALVAAVATAPVWIDAFGVSGGQSDPMIRALRIAGTPVAAGVVGFWLGALVFQLQQHIPLALFLVGVLFSALCIPLVFLLLFLLNGLPIPVLGALALIGAFFCTPLLNRMEGSRNAS
jgi:hypothetical protein